MGVKELRLLKKWREILRTDFEKAEKAKQAKKDAAADSGKYLLPSKQVHNLIFYEFVVFSMFLFLKAKLCSFASNIKD